MTTIRRLMTIIGVSAALTAFPLPSGASTASTCAHGKPTAASYNWDFHREANNLFEEIRGDAEQARDYAARLQSYEDEPELDLQAHGDQLTYLKNEVNDMGRKLCRLETIRRGVAPWQQKTIDRIALHLQLMADNTQDAIVFVNSHQSDLFNQTYWRYADNIYSQANDLTRSVGNAVDYAKVLGEYHQLRGELGVGRNAS